MTDGGEPWRAVQSGVVPPHSTFNSRRLRSGGGGCRFSGDSREGQRDRDGTEGDGGGAEVEPAVALERVEDPSADDGANRHAEAREHRRRAEHRAHDALAEVLARE